MALSMAEREMVAGMVARLREQTTQLLERVDRLEAIRRSDLAGRAGDVTTDGRGEATRAETGEIRDAVDVARAAVDAIAVDAGISRDEDGYYDRGANIDADTDTEVDADVDALAV